MHIDLKIDPMTSTSLKWGAKNKSNCSEPSKIYDWKWSYSFQRKKKPVEWLCESAHIKEQIN